MLKRLLSCLALTALLGGLSLEAQDLQTSGKRTRPMQSAQLINGISYNKSAQVPMKITPAVGQFWWGYYELTDEVGSLGAKAAETYDCAVYIPNSGILKDATISGIRFLLQDGDVYSNVKAWVTKVLPETGSSAFDVETDNVDKPVGMSGGFNEVSLTKPYTMTGDGMYVGISFDIKDISTSDGRYPIAITYGTDQTTNSLFLRTSKSIAKWSDGSKYGKLALQVLLSAPNAPKNSIAISASPDLTVIANAEQLMTLKLTDKGTYGINSFDYDVTIGDKTQSHHYGMTTSFTNVFGNTSIQVPVNTPSDLGYLKPTVKITKVNGVDNEETVSNSAVCPLINLQYSAPRKSVMEEFTGTWCGWCPRGIVGMNNLSKEFGDKFIGIAVHDEDTMSTESYTSIIALVSGFPSSLIDRTFETDPYLGSQEKENAYHSNDAFKAALAMPSEAELSLSTSWKDDNTIDLTSSINFYYSRTDNPYRVAYVIVEDSLHGTSDAWAQENYYSYVAARWTSDDMAEYTKDADKLSDLKFDHVARVIKDATGIANSLSGAFEAGKTYTHNTQIDVTKFQCPLQNKNNLKAIVLLINTTSGKIVNAQETKIGGQVGFNGLSKEALTATIANFNGMMTINTNVNEATNIAIYKADGSLVASKAFVGSTNILTSGLKGVYIVRVSNSKGASVRKVVL